MAAAATATTRRLFEMIGYGAYGPFAARSAVFGAGGYHWRIHVLRDTGNGDESVGIYLHLVTKHAKAMASFEFSLLDATARLPPWVLYQTPLVEFDSTAAEDDPAYGGTFGVHVFRAYLDEAAGYVDHIFDRLFIECSLTVVVDPAAPPAPASGGSRCSGTTISPAALDNTMPPPPPSDMMEQLGNLLATSHGADVVFAVDGELFPAHRTILAMRSPVFKAELYGPMKESGADQLIEIDDMRPDVFSALLAYIYTDSLPTTTADHRRRRAGAGAGDDDDDDDDMMWDLLVAADRYGVERLKVACERALCARLDVGNVANLLGLADQYHCSTLKDACIEFMTSASCRMDEISKTQGYAQLRSDRLSLLVEVLEKSSKFRRL